MSTNGGVGEVIMISASAEGICYEEILSENATSNPHIRR
jgi:hypothetical protein